MIKRLQNKVAESRFSLPIASIYGLLMWLPMGVTSNANLQVSLPIFILTTYLVIELNNRNALLRTYSRMVSCSFIFLMLMSPWMINASTLGVLCLFTASISVLFRLYQNRLPSIPIFYTILLLGIVSLVWPPILFFVPLLILVASAYLRSFNFYALLATILAVATPYWLLLPVALYFNKLDLLESHFTTCTDIFNAVVSSEQTQSNVSFLLSDKLQVVVTMSILLVFFFVGTIHFLRNSYKDKIHVRMLYYSIITLASIVLIATIALLLLVPFGQTWAEYLIAILTMLVSPLIAHYITFTNTRITNISFFVFLIIVLLATAFNHAIEANIVQF